MPMLQIELSTTAKVAADEDEGHPIEPSLAVQQVTMRAIMAIPLPVQPVMEPTIFIPEMELE